MRFDVHRIHVGVFGERQRKAPDGLRAVAVSEVVAEGLVGFENGAHVTPSGRTVNGVDATPTVRRREACRLRSGLSIFMVRSYRSSTSRLHCARDTQGMMLLPLALSASDRK